MKALGHIVAVITFLLLSAILGYCVLNNTAHGPNLQDCVIWFCPALVLGVLLIFTRLRILGFGLAATALIGIWFTWSAPRLRIMMGYEEWILAGMPSPNPYRIPILVGVFSASVILLSLPFFARKRT